MITDYASLITEVQEELNRRDLEVKTETFVQLAESQMIRDLEVGTGLEINPNYRLAITRLSETNAVNWLLNDHPDVYFYATLLHSAPYLDDDQRISVWAGLYGQIRDSINSDARKYPINAEIQAQHSHHVRESCR